MQIIKRRLQGGGGVVQDFRSSLQKGPNVDRCSLALEIEKGSWELFALGLIRGKVAIH